MVLPKGSVKIIVALISAATTLGVSWIGARSGVVSFPNPGLEQQVASLKQKLENRSSLAGDYEWQWAGDKWLGSLTFTGLSNGDIRARTEVRAINYSVVNGVSKMSTLWQFRSDVDGSASVQGGTTLLLHLPVEVSSEYMRSHHTFAKRINLDAELHPVEAFAGRIQYRGDVSAQGDIILVKYRSDARTW